MHAPAVVRLVTLCLEQVPQPPDFSPGFRLPEIHAPLGLQRNTWKMKVWPSKPCFQPLCGSLCWQSTKPQFIRAHGHRLPAPTLQFPLPWLSARPVLPTEPQSRLCSSDIFLCVHLLSGPSPGEPLGAYSMPSTVPKTGESRLTEADAGPALLALALEVYHLPRDSAKAK